MADPRLARPLWRGRTNVDAFTIAWIEHAEQIVRERWPKIAHLFVITQGGYQGTGGDPDSAGTHARGGGTDMRWCGHPGCLLALRLAGGFVWWRKPLWRDGVLVWPDHFHGAPIGHPFMAPALQRQETAYFNRRNGLANNGPDDGPRLDPIPRPIWPYPEVDIVTEDEMNQVADKVVAKLLAADVGGDRTVKAALRMAAKAPALARDLDRTIEAVALRLTGGAETATVDRAAIVEALKIALREGTD